MAAGRGAGGQGTGGAGPSWRVVSGGGGWGGDGGRDDGKGWQASGDGESRARAWRGEVLGTVTGRGGQVEKREREGQGAGATGRGDLGNGGSDGE